MSKKHRVAASALWHVLVAAWYMGSYVLIAWLTSWPDTFAAGFGVVMAVLLIVGVPDWKETADRRRRRAA